MSSSVHNSKSAGAGDLNNSTNDDGNNSSSNNNKERGGDGESSSSVGMSLTSDEVNYLVFRYLQESGFVHSAFTFVYESMLGKTNIRNGDRSIPPGALISFLQKGLQYVGIEENLRKESKKSQKSNKTEVGPGDETDFSLLSPPVVAALTRTDPPIHLTLPPAAAAAAVKSRLETVAKLQATRMIRERAETASAPSDRPSLGSSGSARAEKELVPQQQQQQQSLEQQSHTGTKSTSTDSEGANTARSAAHLDSQPQSSPQEEKQQQQNSDSGKAAVQSSASQLQEEQQRSQEQQQQPHPSDDTRSESPRNDPADTAGLPELSGSSIASNNAAKRGNGDKRTLKKNKPSKKIQQQALSAAGNKVLHMESPTPGFATFEEAVAQLEAKNASSAPQPMDIEVSNNSNNSRSLTDAESSMSSSRPQADSTKLTSEIGLNGQRPYPRNGSRTSVPSMPGNGNLALMPSDGLMSHPPKKPQQEDLDQTMSESETLAQPPQENRSTSERDVEQEDQLTNASNDEILELRMHSSEVFMCAWNPVFTNFIATGSGDASARIWQMGGADAAAGLGPVRLLPHGEDPRDRKNKDVTTLEWSSDGKLLATGSYDGVARVWSRSGALLHTLRGHKGPIFSLKWNKRGNYLLSGSYDKTTIVWDVSGNTGFVEQQFNDHQAPALDVDWRDDTTFASCSTDKTVNICKVGVSAPLKTYSGHTDEVNAVKWDPSGDLLASCSDDCTAKVWDVSGDRSAPLQDFKSHRQEIYTVKWSPTGPGSQNPQKKCILATASFDGSVRLWNVQDGSCIRVFSRHRDSVYSVAFSPSGSFLASGSLAGQMYIWNVDEGRPVKSYKGKGDIFEVAWNKEETRVAACFSSNIVAILDFKIRP
ncbi:like/WD repeat-containing protein TBL1XR1 [Seminavis robusta]|uniref:Like/WD repeat-containing protein TBL1XR1 n=1 Tax=Seminavis robusta TaxID=568900 RepID=A0A9N8HLL1_9STRA|nr:like/WD repeat-containing protein TBL1XR1 [Seminavis robusta]|eukprot:Sro925_g220890.1 like/WD repeat-containing protein TBL1XR1 (876) ;mRNA; f:24809-27704